MGQIFVYMAMMIMAALVVIIAIRITKGIFRFSRNLKYINSEIERTTGSEQRSWIRKKRRTIRKFYVFFFE